MLSRYFFMCVVEKEWVIVCLCVTQPSFGKQPHQVDLIETSFWREKAKTLLDGSEEKMLS